jgi:hypothetical protein
MKTHFFVICGGSITLLALLATAPVLSAPPEAKVKTGPQPNATNVVPQSVFTIPGNFAEGRDPFYPNARYMFGAQPIIRAAQATPGASLLVLNGISGSAGRKLVIINGRTMAEGETNEINTASGRVPIRCIEIKRESAVIEVIGGERRELHLRD